MPLYHSYSAFIKIAEDSTLAQLIASRSISTTESDAADIEEAVTHKMEIADAVVDQAVSLGSLSTCKQLHIISDRAISVKINGGDTGIPIGHTATEGGSMSIPATSITALSVSNASGGVANVHFILSGV